MSDPSIGELFQDSFSSVSESLSDLRTQQVFTFIGTILTTLGTIFLNTIAKLFVIAVAKVVLLTIIKHVNFSPISDILQDISPSSKAPLVNIEDAHIQYSSPGEEYSVPGEEYGGRYKYSASTGTGYGDEEPVYVYRQERKEGQQGGGFWEDLLDWVVFDIL